MRVPLSTATVTFDGSSGATLPFGEAEPPALCCAWLPLSLDDEPASCVIAYAVPAPSTSTPATMSAI